MRYPLTEVVSEILGVDIPERGVNAMLLCALHDEDTPSLSVNLENGRWQCFGCGQMGGIEKLARLVGATLDDATRQDILIRGLTTQPQQRRDFASLARGFAESGRSGRGHKAIGDYLGARRLPDDVASHFGLGFDESRSCITLPYWDGEAVTGLKLRAGNGFKFSEDNSAYGLYNVNDARGRAVVAIGEGESDSHSLWTALVHDRRSAEQHGLSGEPADSGQVAVCGTSGALKSDRLWQLFALDLLFARKVYVCYDADETGDEAFEYAARALGDKAIRIRPTKGNDITEHILAGGNLEELGIVD